MSSSDRITQSKGKSEGFSIPYKMNKGKGKGRKSTNHSTAVYQCHRWSSAAATTSSCPTVTVITSSHQAHFLSVYCRSLSSRKTTLQGTTCSWHSGRLTPVNTTTAWPQASRAQHSITSQSCHTPGTISNSITRFWFTFISNVCYSIYRRQIQQNPETR